MLVQIYGREGCHLCLEAAQLVAKLRQENEFNVEYIDIDSSPDLSCQFRCSIPIVTFNGGQRVALRISEERLRRALRLALQRESDLSG
jgi:thiol-disulfide isomerase/thioredoxin